MLPPFVPCFDSAPLTSVAGLLALALLGGCGGKTAIDAGEASTLSASTDSGGTQADTVGGGDSSAGGSANSSAGGSGGATSAGGSASGAAGGIAFTTGRGCPDSLPEVGGPCELTGSTCQFSVDFCGCSRPVGAWCHDRRWHLAEPLPGPCWSCGHLAEPLPGACWSCAFVVDGAECGLPAGCEPTCYSISRCDGQVISRCVDGRWSVHDECSK